MTNSVELDKEIKELEDKLGSLRARQQLVKAQESLAKDKASSLLEDETLNHLIQKLQNELVKCELGLALSIDYKRNWVFIVNDRDSKEGLSSFKVLDPKDKRVFYGLVESFNQELTSEGIQTWLQTSLKLVVSLLKVKSSLYLNGANLTFKSYDNVLEKLYFTYTSQYPNSYDCILVVKRPYVLIVNDTLTFESESCSLRFKNSNICIQTRAENLYVHDEDYTGSFEQILSVHKSFTTYKDLGKVMVELEEELTEFRNKFNVVSH